MITLTMQCNRCGKEVSHNMTTSDLNQDAVRKFGFVFIHDGKTNLMVCNDCEKLYKGLKDKLEETQRKKLCEFFKNCEEKEDGKTKDAGRSGRGRKKSG